jgi:hypothetical protein
LAPTAIDTLALQIRESARLGIDEREHPMMKASPGKDTMR